MGLSDSVAIVAVAVGILLMVYKALTNRNGATPAALSAVMTVCLVYLVGWAALRMVRKYTRNRTKR